MEDTILLDQLEFDVIILGTSLTETILSSALAKAGKKVAHFDKNEWYGGLITSHTLKTLNNSHEEERFQKYEVPEGALPINNFNLKTPIINYSTSLYNYVRNKNVNNNNTADFDFDANKDENNENTIIEENIDVNNNEKEEEVSTEKKERKLRDVKDSQWELLIKDDRRYSLDIVSNVIWSVGEDVNYFVDSGVHRYLEFKTFQNAYIYSSSSATLQPVPASKSEIFKTKYLSLLEKRALTRFMNLCSSGEISAETLASPFVAFLREQNLPPKLQEFLLYAVVFLPSSSSSQITTDDGIKKMKEYMASMGRFGNTPFIFPLYGNSEFPQAFSRLSAVYGTDFVLKKSAKYLNITNDENKTRFTNLVCTANQTLSAPYFVCSESYLSDDYQKVLSRAIVISNKSLVDDGHMSYFVIPPGQQNENTIICQQFDSSMYLCPPSKCSFY